MITKRNLGIFLSIAVAMLLLFCIPLQCQNTTVSGTVSDTDAQTWNNGTWKADLHTAPGYPNFSVYTVNGAPLNTSQISWSGALDSGGSFSQAMYSNALISPAGTTWTFTFCPKASAPCYTTGTISISGGSQSITSFVGSLPPVRFSALAVSPYAYGYADGEISPTPQPGGMYYNITSNALRVWSGSSWSSAGSSSGGSSNPNDVVVTAAPFYASTDDYTTTNTTGTNAPGTTINVASCATFTANQGVFIQDAGAVLTGRTGTTANGSFQITSTSSIASIGSGALITGTNIPAGTRVQSASGTTVYMLQAATGANGGLTFTNPYIGTVVGCNGTTLTVTPATTTSVSTGTLVQHDEGAAINAAVNQVATLTALTGVNSGTVWFPTAPYLVNGVLQDTSGANAVIKMPTLVNYGTVLPIVSLQGFGPRSILIGGSPFAAASTTQSTATIWSSIPQGNVIGGYNSSNVGGAGFTPFTNVWLDIQHMNFMTPLTNPGMVMVNATNIVAFTLDDSNCASLAVTVPVNPSSGCYYEPTLSNAVRIQIGMAGVGGFYNAFKLGEHSTATEILAGTSVNCITVDSGVNTWAGGGTGQHVSNGVVITHAWCGPGTNGIVAGTEITMLEVGLLDLEQLTANGIIDTANKLHGTVRINVAQQASGFTYCNAKPNGAAGVRILMAQCGDPDTPPSVGLEDWSMQEGLGSTFVNGGLDLSNSMTAANVTWATTAGYNAKAAVFNGTTSVANAANATNTAFDGSLPFSICAWLNPTAWTTSPGLIDNLGAGPAFPGISFRLFGSDVPPAGRLDLYLINTVVSNANLIHVFSTSATTVALAQNNLACFTYDGTKSAAGTLLYANGVLSPSTAQFNNLTGSIASSVPFHIGSITGGTNFFNGVEGPWRIWNRVLTDREIRYLYLAGPSGKGVIN